MVAEIIALQLPILAEGDVVEIESAGLVVTVEGMAKSGDETAAKTRFTPPKAPEGVSRDIGALFRPNVALGRYWFYVVVGEKCGTATLKVVRSRKGLDVLVVAVDGNVPGYLRDLRMGGNPIELAALVDPKSFGDDEMSQKAKQLALVLADIRRRMAPHSRNRRHGGRIEQARVAVVSSSSTPASREGASLENSSTDEKKGNC